MSKIFFRTLARLNRIFLPSLWRKDLRALTRWEKALVVWRYWVTTRSL